MRYCDLCGKVCEGTFDWDFTKFTKYQVCPCTSVHYGCFCQQVNLARSKKESQFVLKISGDDEKVNVITCKNNHSLLKIRKRYAVNYLLVFVTVVIHLVSIFVSFGTHFSDKNAIIVSAILTGFALIFTFMGQCMFFDRPSETSANIGKLFIESLAILGIRAGLQMLGSLLWIVLYYTKVIDVIYWWSPVAFICGLSMVLVTVAIGLACVGLFRFCKLIYRTCVYECMTEQEHLENVRLI